MQPLARLRTVWALAALLWLSWPQGVFAQAVEVNAPAGVDIFMIAAKPKVRIATVGSSGRASLPFDSTTKGTELQVVVARCGDRMSIVLVERGRTDPDCSDDQNRPQTQQQQVRCSCDPSGLYIVWGTGAVINVSASGQVTLGPGRASPGGGGAGSSIGLGGVGFIADLDFVTASHGDDPTACNDIEDIFDEFGFVGTCASNARVGGWSGDIGVTFARVLAVKVGYLSLGEATIDASASDNLFDLVAEGRFGRTSGVTFVGVVRVPVGPVVVFGEGGMWRWSSEITSDIALRLNNQTVESESLSSDFSGTDPIFGGGVEFWFTPRVGVSGGVRVVKVSGESSNGEEGDIDERFTAIFAGLKLGF